MIDGDPEVGWCNHQRAATVVAQLAEPVGSVDGTEFVITLSCLYAPWPQHILGRFRLATTTAKPPSLQLPGVLLPDRAATPLAPRPLRDVPVLDRAVELRNRSRDLILG